MGGYNLLTMTHILESIAIKAPPQPIWEYVQEYRRRAEWDVTTLRFEPLDTKRVDNDVRVFVRTAGGMEYEGVYISYEPYKVSAVKMTRPIGMSRFVTWLGRGATGRLRTVRPNSR